MKVWQIYIFFKISNARHCWFKSFVRFVNMKLIFPLAEQFHVHRSYKTRESTMSSIGNFEENIDLSHMYSFSCNLYQDPHTLSNHTLSMYYHGIANAGLARQRPPAQHDQLLHARPPLVGLPTGQPRQDGSLQRLPHTGQAHCVPLHSDSKRLKTSQN